MLTVNSFLNLLLSYIIKRPLLHAIQWHKSYENGPTGFNVTIL